MDFLWGKSVHFKRILVSSVLPLWVVLSCFFDVGDGLFVERESEMAVDFFGDADRIFNDILVVNVEECRWVCFLLVFQDAVAAELDEMVRKLSTDSAIVCAIREVWADERLKQGGIRRDRCRGVTMSEYEFCLGEVLHQCRKVERVIRRLANPMRFWSIPRLYHFEIELKEAIDVACVSIKKIFSESVSKSSERDVDMKQSTVVHH